MKNYKELLEGFKETKDNPLIVSTEDPEGKIYIGQVDLNMAAEFYGLTAKKILKDPKFWAGEVVKSDGKWSTAKNGIYIQLSNHSKFYKKGK